MLLSKVPIGVVAACWTLAVYGMLASPVGAQSDFSQTRLPDSPSEALAFNDASCDTSCDDMCCGLIGCTGCDRQKVDVEIGAKAPIIDGIGWVLGVPRKILLWDRRAKNHNVSWDTVNEVTSYVDCRGLHATKVRVNQYDPVGEWKRLVANKEVGAGWRYTVGALSTLGYTVFPGRIFGHDNYNPYTDTLSVYSDAPPLALAEAAYAKDVRQRNYPGTYATVQHLPLVAMWHETLATQETLRYTSAEGSRDEPAKVRRLLYARYGMELGGAVGNALSSPGVGVGVSLFPGAGAVAGHTVANVKERSNSRKRRR